MTAWNHAEALFLFVSCCFEFDPIISISLMRLKHSPCFIQTLLDINLELILIPIQIILTLLGQQLSTINRIYHFCELMPLESISTLGSLEVTVWHLIRFFILRMSYVISIFVEINDISVSYFHHWSWWFALIQNSRLLLRTLIVALIFFYMSHKMFYFLNWIVPIRNKRLHVILNKLLFQITCIF